ncbi:MAG: UDP-4-amino-4,6-dideoxy-N-acetyl-beta-L-altrosamine transaminase [Holosporaceae bacterium]|jgi:UDP-4-amino-4,6-dideoxy-N-acetyl-beta-L-altrosamine transaminase|nr:UDP-4-amino-4,6-dideoxy-N-acetyl-beta-L-altrosamine transaminase [Holosporaceae bacterium]
MEFIVMYQKMIHRIFGYGKQSISLDDIESIAKVLNSDLISQGPKINEFETAICEYTGAKYCIVVANATAALHLSMIALDVKSGDEVITTPLTFMASANCISYVGGTVKFADIEPETANIDVKEIKNRLTTKTKALIPVHFAGQSCDMSAIGSLAKARGISVVEDASHAIGSDYNGAKVGSCAHSDATVFSFHPVKNMTTGEGGAITTNSKELYEKLLLLRSHGMVKNDPQLTDVHGKWFYEMHRPGFNYRMTDLQAALGLSQLKRIDKFKEKRRGIVSLYKKILAEDSRISFLVEKNYSNACFHLCPALIDFENLKIDKKKFFNDLWEAGLHLQVHYIPVHWFAYYRNLGFCKGDFPNAEKYYEKTISLPLYPDLSDSDVEYIAETFVKVLDNA